jgi:hypothetical protein
MPEINEPDKEATLPGVESGEQTVPEPRELPVVPAEPQAQDTAASEGGSDEWDESEAKPVKAKVAKATKTKTAKDLGLKEPEAKEPRFRAYVFVTEKSFEGDDRDALKAEVEAHLLESGVVGDVDRLIKES